MILGLRRGTVRLAAYQPEWKDVAAGTMTMLRRLLGDAAADIQHVGSTAVPTIHAKPIIDIAVGVRQLDAVKPYVGLLRQHGVFFRGQDVAGQLLFVMGDMAKDTRTCHIHVVIMHSEAWNNYIDLRDYLCAFPDKARQYDQCKGKLADLFACDRKSYTAGKAQCLSVLLAEAERWRRAGSPV